MPNYIGIVRYQDSDDSSAQVDFDSDDSGWPLSLCLGGSQSTPERLVRRQLWNCIAMKYNFAEYFCPAIMICWSLWIMTCNQVKRRILIMSIIISQVWRRWRGQRGGKLHSGADCLCWDHILSLHFGMSRFQFIWTNFSLSWSLRFQNSLNSSVKFLSNLIWISSLFQRKYISYDSGNWRMSLKLEMRHWTQIDEIQSTHFKTLSKILKNCKT